MPKQFLHGIEVIQIDNGTRPIQTLKSSVIGLIGTAPDAEADIFPLNEPVLLINERQKAAKLGAAGTLKDSLDAIFDQAGAVVVVVRVEQGNDTASTLSNLVGDSTAMTGVHAFTAAEARVKVTPRVLIAPGFTGSRSGGNANPVVAELQGIASALRAVILADAPAGSSADAVAYRQDWDDSRIYLCAPQVMVWDTETNSAVAQPASPRIAGKIAWLDNNKGFWYSPSNHTLNGVTGISRPISFALSDKNSEANFLNENQIATLIHKDGYRLWGNRTTASDPQWAFLSVRRTADMIYESIEKALLWSMDKPFSAQLVLDIANSVNAYLRHLIAAGALLGGKAWIDEELNTQEQLQAGKLFVDFDLEPPAPLEHLTFRARRNGGYYEELLAEVSSALSTQAS